MTLQPAREILTMEEVREQRFTVPDEVRGADARLLSARIRRLAATVEHWHREAQGKDERAREWSLAAQRYHDDGVEIAKERGRLRALVDSQRQALELHAKRFSSGGRHVEVYCSMCSATQGHNPRCLLNDPDGLTASELAAKDREDAEKWRALMEATDDQLDPKHVAFIERATRAIAEGEEELRLLRELERAAAAVDATPIGAWADGGIAAVGSALGALSAFRAGQKEGAGAG